jgi:hypothetical protein
VPFNANRAAQPAPITPPPTKPTSRGALGTKGEPLAHGVRP